MRHQWWNLTRRVGWGLLGAAVLLLGGWIVAQASGTRGQEFDRLVGWANIFGLWVGGLGVALVAFDTTSSPSAGVRPWGRLGGGPRPGRAGVGDADQAGLGS